jgi:hypothetical protein
MPTSAVCGCGTRTNKKICPHCHNDLPSEFGATDSFTIALVGAKETGKSHYIAVLIHELTNRIGEKFGASLSARDEQTIRRYKQDFRRYIYELREVIPLTPSAFQNVNVRYPLIYRLSFQRRRLLLFRSLRVSSLVFFDTAGEDLDHIDVMSTEAKYLANSHGIIFLLDPLQMQGVRDRLGNSISLPGAHTEPHEIVGRVAELVRRAKGLGPVEKIEMPIALTFSKIDAVRSLIDIGSPIHRAADHDGVFDLDDADRVNDSMRAYVAQWSGSGFHNFITHNFATFSYFGVSALGSSPDGGRLAKGVAPYRIEDPFLWILYRLRIVSGSRKV